MAVVPAPPRYCEPANGCLLRSSTPGTVAAVFSALLWLIVFSVFQPGLAISQERLVLVPAQAVERQINGVETHVYQFDLGAGQMSSIRLDQQGIDLQLKLLSGDRKTLVDVDREHTGNGTETITLTTQRPETFSIEVIPVAPNGKSGRYSIVAAEPTQASDVDREAFQGLLKYCEAVSLLENGNAEAAIEPAKASIEIRQRVFGPDSIEAAYSLIALGSAYSLTNKTDLAEPILHQALDAIANARGKDSFEYSDALLAAGRSAFQKGDLKSSQDMLLKALTIREKIAGVESLAAANILQPLAVTYRSRDDLPNAERANLRGLKIREGLLGKNHVKTADILNNLGLMYYGAGDYANAEAILVRSLSIREGAVGPIHRLVGASLNNLGLVEWKKGDYQKAEAYWQRSLSIFEKVSGPESDDVAGSLANLAIIYKEHLHDLGKAEETQKRALDLSIKRNGEYSVATGNSVSSLGLIYRAQGDYARAEEYGLRALRILERSAGPNHHNTVLVLGSLARVYVLKGDARRALEYFKRIESIEGPGIPLNITIGSERQKLAYFSQLQQPDRNVTFLVEVAPENAEARDLVLNQIIQRKGRVLDALSQGLLELGRRAGPEERDLISKLNAANSEISTFSIEGARRLSADDYEKQLADRLAVRDKLEEVINRKSSAYYEPSRPATIESVRSLIPDDAALIEFAVWYPFKWASVDSSNPYGDPRYIAFVLRKNGEVKWRDLGAAAPIDKAIAAMRDSFRTASSIDWEGDARSLYDLVYKPIREFTGDARHLLVSPDGELNLVPFEAMMSETGRFLIEDYSVSYLSSGRELSRLGVARPSKGPPLIVANPAFGFSLPSKAGAEKASAGGRGAAVHPISETYFAPLSGSEQEANAIRSVFPNATLLKGDKATESAVKATAAPTILHVATHGYFLRNDEEVRDPGSDYDNPLLLSGLALAGANRRDARGDDGILTALEASALNLWGTKLVVLSACDTGVGTVRDGEGVYGLRRSFAIAGAETIVMSLWPVSDQVTRELMTGFYTNLKNGLGRGKSLRDIKISMLNEPNRRHPFYWASFIESGEWANLNGKR
jgi:CHAT domain-containing protein/Tfp pilus assembly protein PilF